MTTLGASTQSSGSGNNNNNNNNNNNGPNNGTGGLATATNQFYRLKVEDALSYLDQVKFQFEQQPEVYNHFLDIMKEFKSQTIDTPGVISRVSNLFRGHTDLIEGFNTFLPPGYKIEVQANDCVHFTAPNSTLSTLVQPIQAGNAAGFMPGKTLAATLGRTTPTPPPTGNASRSIQVPTVLAATNTTSLVNLTTASGLVKADNQNNQVKGEPVILTSFLANAAQGSLSSPVATQMANKIVQNLPVKILPAAPVLAASASLVQSINITKPPSPQPVANAGGQPPAPNAQNQVEFGHAINYVNKIKSRFSNQPDIYKSFLEILHTYQKQQKNIKEGITSSTQNFLSEAEVYAKVAKLFKNQEDLLIEFSQFLPDANSSGAAASTAAGSTAAASQLTPQQIMPATGQPQLIQDVQVSTMIANNLNEFNSTANNSNQQQQQQLPVLNMPITVSTTEMTPLTVSAKSNDQPANPPATTVPSNKQKLISSTLAASQHSSSSTASSSSNTTQSQVKNKSDSQPMTPISQNLTMKSNNLNKDTNSTSCKRIASYQPVSTKKQKVNNQIVSNNVLKPMNEASKLNKVSSSQNDAIVEPAAAPGGSIVTGTAAAKYNGAILNEITFFDRLKKALRTQQVYDNFLKCLALFNQDIVTRAELIALVEPFLGKFANLYRWFKDYVENKPLNSSILIDQYPAGDAKSNTAAATAATAAPNGKNRIYLPPGNNYSLEIDYSSCMQYGASYRDISSYPQPINSNQSELCKQVLNAIYVSFPSWSEDSTFISSKKNQYEELIFRIEDDRFELDVVLETNMSTIRVLENVMTKIGHMSSDELSKFRLSNTLGGTSETVHIKAINRVYGDKAKDFIDGLKRNPSIAVPLVLKRLRAKDEEWREAKKALEKQWSEQIERNYLKSLDHCAAPFKQNDQKYLKTKSLINEIEAIYSERQKAKQDSQTNSTSLGAPLGVEQPKQVSSHHQPHIVIKYEDKSILEDAGALIIHHVKRQTAIQREDKHRIKEIIYHFLPDLLFVPRGALSDDESSPDPPEKATVSSVPTSSQHESVQEEPDEGNSKRLRSTTTAANINSRHTDANKRRLTEADAERSRDHSAELKTPDDMYRLFYVDDHWYLFYRYHHILCERLHKIYKHSLHLAEQLSIEAKSREQSVAEALKLRNKSDISPDDYYPAFLDIVRNLLDGNMDSVQYEDTLREMFGIHAYIAFTLDKVVHNCVRQLQYLVQIEASSSVKQLYMDEMRANSLSFSSGGSLCLPSITSSLTSGGGGGGGGCGGKVSSMSYSSVINAEQAYQKKVETLLNNQNCYKILSFKNSCRLTIELMDSQEEAEEEEDTNEEITDIVFTLINNIK